MRTPRHRTGDKDLLRRVHRGTTTTKRRIDRFLRGKFSLNSNVKTLSSHRHSRGDAKGELNDELRGIHHPLSRRNEFVRHNSFVRRVFSRRFFRRRDKLSDPFEVSRTTNNEADERFLKRRRKSSAMGSTISE